MISIKKLVTATTVAILSIVLSGCAQNVSSDTYSAQDMGRANKAEQGVIISKRAVNVDNNTGVGGLAGAGAGAAAGSAIGGSTQGNIIGALGGAIIGGLAGNAIDKGINHHAAFEYIVKLKKGSTVSVVQTADEQFALHQRVIVIYGHMTRLIADTTA